VPKVNKVHKVIEEPQDILDLLAAQVDLAHLAIQAN
jgi:hypothetical protein